MADGLVVDRMELADCGSPEKLIAEIMRQVPQLPLPVPIEALASAVEITAIHRLTTFGFEGGLITQAERTDGQILVNAKGTQQRQRFTIGHELGHYLMLTHQPKTAGQFACSKSDLAVQKADRDDKPLRMELEANRFSAGILMPLVRFRPDMRALGSPDLDHVIELARRYDMSKEATALHYVRHHDENCVVVVSRYGRMQRIYRSIRFPFLDCAQGQPLPTNSGSNRLMHTQRSRWDEIDCQVWITSEDVRFHGRKLQEQAVRLSDGWMMTLLIAPDIDDELEEEELLPDTLSVWENPRFPGKRRRRP